MRTRTIPPLLQTLAEAQRERDITHGEMLAIKHRTREVLAMGFTIYVRRSTSAIWQDVLAWLYALPVGLPSEARDDVAIVALVEQPIPKTRQTEWLITASRIDGQLLARLTLPADRFLASWPAS